jgi:hypothetical protein
MQYVSTSGLRSRVARLAAALGVVALATLAALAPAADAAYGPHQWTLRFAGPATTNAPFSLYNQDEQREAGQEGGRVLRRPHELEPEQERQRVRRHGRGERAQREVRYGTRSCGINLVWSPGTTREWRFERAGGATGPLRYGEPLALFNTAYRKYVYYKSRSCGINLSWTDSRETQWRLRGGTTGTTVATTSLALYNDIERDFMVYGSRPFGINLMWYQDTQSPYWCIHHPSAPGC